MSDQPPLDLSALRARLSGERGPRLWRSLEELADAPDFRRFVEAEFPDVVAAGGVDRRTLLRLMGASLALAGLAACDERDAPLVSPARGTPGYVPGEAIVFATSLELGGVGRGVLVKTQAGRPIKIEGNALHPASLGATDVFAQADVLSLYDPDRSLGPRHRAEERSLDEARAALVQIRAEAASAGGEGLHLVMPPVASPTAERLIAAARAALPGLRVHRHAAISEANRHAGLRSLFGRDLDVVYDLTAADAILTLGGDLFAFEPGHLRYAADYQARRRDIGRPMPRLVAVETTPSLVGARADERVALPPAGIETFVRALAARFGVGGVSFGTSDPAVTRVAAMLREAGSRALVVPGREQPPIVHALAHALNANLGALGSTVRLIEPVLPREGEGLRGLTEALTAGAVRQIVILGGNPAYDAPADLDFAARLRAVPVSVHIGYQRDETAAACFWHVPALHPLESWGDLRAFDGTAGLVQPAARPRVSGLSALDVLAVLAGEDGDAQALVQATWRAAWRDGFDERWRLALEAGIVAESAAPAVAAAPVDGWSPQPPGPPAEDFEITFAPDPSVWDGRYANNGWLQELPRPLTKQVWGNSVLMAPQTAERLGIAQGRLVRVAAGGRELSGPVLVMPGHAPGCVTLPLGYGRSAAGALGDGVGFDAYRLRTTDALWRGTGAVQPRDGTGEIVTTQHHHSMEGRDIVRVVAPGEGVPPLGELPSLYPEWRYDGHAWGMSVDLDACIGCNACVIACQAENNVAVVGADEVARGREMHWLRVDRYYAGTPDEPKTYFQPVPCMHCEKAPCEVVCPVNATVHSSEGLNDMVYNRCVGTRTCSNNCPYKVRRFNFLDWTASDVAPAPEVLNPQVTVRSRGVMEKCTYCVQRISDARIEARVENRTIADGEIVTACQQACPTQAIVFGDVNDPDTLVSRRKADTRNYALLGELNTRPRTTYLARIERREPDVEN